MQAVLNNWGDSIGIRLPKKILEHLGLRAGDKVDVSEVDGTIVVKKDQKTRMKELFAACKNYQGEYDYTEIDTGAPAGGEVW